MTCGMLREMHHVMGRVTGHVTRDRPCDAAYNMHHVRRLPPVLAPQLLLILARRHPDDTLRHGADQQSLRHGASQTTPWSAIPNTRRHPDEALVSNPKDTAPPDKGSVSNPKDTAPPRQRPCQQSPRHGATKTTPCPPILMTRRHPDRSAIA